LSVTAVIYNKEHNFFWPQWIFVCEQLVADLYGISSDTRYIAMLLLFHSREYTALNGQLRNVEGTKGHKKREWRKESQTKGENKVRKF
jgi:hypothetical protein